MYWIFMLAWLLLRVFSIFSFLQHIELSCILIFVKYVILFYNLATSEDLLNSSFYLMSNYHIKVCFTNLNNQLYGWPLKVELPQVPKFMWEIIIDNSISVSVLSEINEAIVNVVFLSILVILAWKTGSPIGNSAHQFSKTYWPARLWFLRVSLPMLKL